jgi:hypothetical protein
MRKVLGKMGTVLFSENPTPSKGEKMEKEDDKK